MASPEMVIKQGSNKEEYIFPILDESGNTRNLTNYQVFLYVIDRFSRATILSKELTQVSGSGNEHKFKYTTSSAELTTAGYYDGEIHIKDATGYDEPYDEFPVYVKPSRASSTPDREFEQWLTTNP